MAREKRLSIALLLIIALLLPMGVNATDWENVTAHKSYINGFEDNTFRPLNQVTREQVMSVLAFKAKMTPPFAMRIGPIVPDISYDRWSYDAIEKCIKDGMVYALFDPSMKDNRSFPIKDNIFPTKPITRGELLAVLFDSMDNFFIEQPEPTRSVSFTDILGHRFETEIINMANRGIINGYSDNTFKPDNSITRAEFVKVMNTFFQRCEIKELDENLNKFNDISEKDWFYKDVIEASVDHIYEVEDNKNVWIKELTEEEVDNISWFNFN